MYYPSLNTTYIGTEFIHLPSCHSTNDIASEYWRSGRLLSGGIVVTDTQEKGRGQRGNQWESEAGKNITMSLVLELPSLDISKQFMLTIVTSLAIRDTLTYFVEDEVFIKWPNDIYINHKKICGILIENTYKPGKPLQSVIGIGLNVNQEVFKESKAVSLANLLKKETDHNTILDQLITNFETRYTQLLKQQHTALRKDYLGALYLKDEWHTFISTNDSFLGKIIGVNEQGLLAVERSGSLDYFNFKEISYPANLHLSTE